MKTFKSDLSNLDFPITEKVNVEFIRPTVLKFIKDSNPSIQTMNVISMGELNKYRESYITNFLSNQIGELSDLEKKVINSLVDDKALSDKLLDEKSILTFGQKIADKVAEFGGSWVFIISFVIFITIWIFSNIYFLNNKGFDPYPFILLNLILSCIAALQAPVIMMSQNRQEEKDRDRAKKDYMINLKSELEIRILHEKIDHLILHQQQTLMEVQKVQIDMMKDILKDIESKKTI